MPKLHLVDWIKCITNRLLRAARREAGITLIEVVIAMAIFAVITTSLIGVLSSATAADGLSRQRSIALELAQQQVEYVRQLNYADVGVAGGNPGGVVQGTQSKWVAGLRYTLETRIKFVKDPIIGGVIESANYKQIRVIVDRASDNKELGRVSTYLSSSTRLQSGSLNNGLINVTVQDYVTNELLGGVQVNLDKTWDAGFSAGDVTGTESGMPTFGVATFEGLVETPTSPVGYYDVSALKTGYVTLKEDQPPSQIGLARSGTASPIIRLFKACTITVNVKRPDGQPYTAGPATVTISLGAVSEQVQTNPATGSVTVDTLDGEPIAPGSGYAISADTTDHSHGELSGLSVPINYPLDTSSSFDVQLIPPPPEPADVTVYVRYNSCSTGGVVSGATVNLVWLPNPSDPAHRFQGTTSSQGRVILTGVPLDTYDIKAQKQEKQHGHWVTLQGTTANQQITGDSTFCVSIS